MLEPRKITTIFFDLDHTLWDFEKNSALTFDKIFQEENLPLAVSDFIQVYNPINHDCWRLYRNNQITHDQLRTLRLERTFKKLQYAYTRELLSVVNEKYIHYLGSFTHVFEGTFSLLEALSGHFEMHIITNGFDSVQHHKMKNSGLRPYFKGMVTAQQAGHKKPSPKIFEFALRQAQKKASESLMIGDSLEADVQGALAVGMQAIHFNSHGEPQHHKSTIVNSLDELKSILLH